MPFKKWVLGILLAVGLVLFIGTAAYRVQREHLDLMRQVRSGPEFSPKRQVYEKFFSESRYDLPTAMGQFLKNPFRRDVEILYYRYARSQWPEWKGSPWEVIPYAEGRALKQSNRWSVELDLQGISS